MARNYRKFRLLIFAAIAIAAVMVFIHLSKKSSLEQKIIIQSETTSLSHTSQKTEQESAVSNEAPEIKSDAENNIAESSASIGMNGNIPEKYILEIPFYSQAPLGKWDTFHEEMCEEASILNARLYLENKKLTKDKFEEELRKIQQTEKDKIGEWKSTTVAQTKKWADVYFGENLSIKIIDNPTIGNIEREISAGHPIIAPLAGREIGNPNFTPPGPLYHMLVIKGYDSQNFITNDVGTRKGNSYIYKKEVIMENIHDWNEKDIHLGAKRVLVLSKP
jgi:hypothetical protein